MPHVVSYCLYQLACTPSERALTVVEVMFLHTCVWLEKEGVLCILSG